MRIIWATRGYDWGFKFLESGGYDDPLPIYEKAFENNLESCPFSKCTEQLVALRFIDLEDRKDQFSRPIIHEFVVLEPEKLQDCKTWIDQLWSKYSCIYQQLYRQEKKIG